MNCLFKWITVILLCYFFVQSANASIPDTLTQYCNQNDFHYTPIVVNYINQNQIDSLDMLYQNLPVVCSSKGWNQLVHLFLICVKYPERVDHLNAVEMEFLIDYVYSIKYHKIYVKPKDTVFYEYQMMPDFQRLHEAVQNYLSTYYNQLAIGTLPYQLVGTILQRHNQFFEYLNNPVNQYSSAQVSYNSFTQNKDDINKTGHLFFHFNTSYTFNTQMGNPINMEWLGIDIILPKWSAGASFGYSQHTKAPNYKIWYNQIELAPDKTEMLSFNLWANYFLLHKTRINPYVGIGCSLFDSHHSFIIRGDDKKLSVYGSQVYPEFGLMFGRLPNCWLKLHCSYRFNFMDVDYAGETWTDSEFSSNIYERDIRIGASILVLLISETKHKGQLIGVYK
jgi:hypothetical protein